MNQGRYFIPNMTNFNYLNPISVANPRNGNIINRLFSSIKSFNWKGLLNGANKTINVVNQTIPLIKQAKPMINNVKSIVSLTKAFNNETTIKKHTNTNYQTKANNINKTKNDNYPTFFV